MRPVGVDQQLDEGECITQPYLMGLERPLVLDPRGMKRGTLLNLISISLSS